MKKIWGFGIVAVFLAFSACSSDSDNGTGTSANNSGTSKGKNASQCDMATSRLPATSLAWQPMFGGGCEVTQQFPLDELNALDQQIVAMGYVKKSLSQESYIYTFNFKDYDNLITYNDTLRFTYAAGFFSGNFNSDQQVISQEELALLQAEADKAFLLEACAALLPPGTLTGSSYDECADYVKTGTKRPKSAGASTHTDKEFDQIMHNHGWTCETSASGRGSSFRCKQDYNGKSCTASFVTDDLAPSLNQNLTNYTVGITTFIFNCR